MNMDIIIAIKVMMVVMTIYVHVCKIVAIVVVIKTVPTPTKKARKKPFRIRWFEGKHRSIPSLVQFRY